MIDNINDLPEKIINIEKITFKDFKGEGRVLKIDFNALEENKYKKIIKRLLGYVINYDENNKNIKNLY